MIPHMKKLILVACRLLEALGRLWPAIPGQAAFALNRPRLRTPFTRLVLLLCGLLLAAAASPVRA